MFDKTNSNNHVKSLKILDRILELISTKSEYSELEKVNPTNLVEFLEHLIDDGLIYKQSNFKYRISIKGIQKLASGGFHFEYRNSKLDKILIRVFWTLSPAGAIIYTLNELFGIFN